MLQCEGFEINFFGAVLGFDIRGPRGSYKKRIDMDTVENDAPL
jgi:hypothetical protein